MLVSNNNPTNLNLSPNKDNEVSEPGYLSSLNSTICRAASYIFVPEEKPSWRNALTKTSVGLLGFVSVNPIFSGSDWVATGLLMTGTREICYLAYATLAYPTLPQEFSNSITQKTKYENKINQKNKELARIAKLIKLVGFSGLSLSCLYNHDTLGNAAYFSNNQYILEYYNQPGSTAWEFGSPESGFKCFQIGVCITNLVLNLMELKNFNKDSFLAGNPITEIINTLVIVSFCSQFSTLDSKGKELMDCYQLHGMDCIILPLKEKMKSLETNELLKYLEEQQKLFKNVERIMIANTEGQKSYNLIGEDDGLLAYNVKRCVKTFAKQIFVVNSFSMLKSNIEKYWNKDPLITKNVVHLDIQHKATKQKQKQKTSFDISNINDEDKNLISNDIDLDHRCTSILPINSDQEFTIREKKKTRGIANEPNISKKTKSVKTSGSQCINQVDSLETERKDALERIKELRKEHPVKAVKIEHELKLAAKFINGKIKGLTGSVFRLEWTIGENNYGINFEKPHGQDASNYKGYKLNHVLNVLERAYLVGLSEDLADKYIEEYGLYNIVRIPSFIYFILSNKTNEL